MSELFDEEALLEHVDDDLEFLEETIDMLLEDAPPLLDEIGGALQAGDAESLARTAHTLKGALSNFCADRPTESARVLEVMGREESLAEAPEALLRLREETEQLCKALTAFLKRQLEN